MNNVIQIDGGLYFASTYLNAEKYINEWPRYTPGKDGAVLECITIINATNLTITSASEYGTLNGAGDKWWGIPGVGYLVREENRPRMLVVDTSTNVLLEKISFLQSPYWTVLFNQVINLEVRHSKIDNRRDDFDGHDPLDVTAFNTDGFDMSTCDNVWIHDSSVWNQDDCFDVKDNTKNVVIERVNASGVGLTIGSISSYVNNVTFRDSYMHNTAKGIYLKFRGGGLVSNVLYENIVMDAPEQFAIWIGPAQQCDGCSATNLCSTDGGPCSLCWPFVPGTQCNAPAGGQYTNITLKDITINSPKQSAGVILANDTSPMKNVVFENVVVNNPASNPFGKDQYYCKNVEGVATGTTNPVPPCFKDMTDRRLLADSLSMTPEASLVAPFKERYGYRFNEPVHTASNESVPFKCMKEAEAEISCEGVVCNGRPKACVKVSNSYTRLPAGAEDCEAWVQEPKCDTLPNVVTRRCHMDVAGKYSDLLSIDKPLSTALVEELMNQC